MKKKSLQVDRTEENTESLNGEPREAQQTALPAAFLARMQDLLGDEYEAFAESFQKPRAYGLRLNPLKPASEEDIRRLTELFGLRDVAWARDGYYYDGGTRPGRHPYHEAGLYYIQEPSAMAVAELLDPQPGERILDLCAAPGGKTTQIAGRMGNKGLLVSNEIHPARARILSQNVERFGVGNVVVTNEEPERLAGRFPEYFDRILVDAPCSGEGMFRKDETARREWTPDSNGLCARRQAEILEQAARMLRPGGRLVYSTCTFAPEEDEGTVQAFLDRHGEYTVEKTAAHAGFSPGRPDWIRGGSDAIGDTVRIWPHKADGEGHFAAVLRKEQTVQSGAADRRSACPETDRAEGKNRAASSRRSGGVGKEIPDAWRQFVNDTYREAPLAGSEEELRRRMVLYGEQLYLLPEEIGRLDGLKILRPGLHLGTVRKGRFEPSHALALYSSARSVIRRCDLSGSGREILAYLRGETVSAVQEEEYQTDNLSSCDKSTGKSAPDVPRKDASQADDPQNGWTLITTDGFSVGWGKRVGSIIKNHYPKGLRQDLKR